MSPSKNKRGGSGGHPARVAGRTGKPTTATPPPAPSGGMPRAQRLGLLLLGILFIVLFVGFAVDQGLGKPSVPSDAIAIVEDAGTSASVPPPDVSEADAASTTCDAGDDNAACISESAYKRALFQAALRSGAKSVPKPGDPKFADVQTAAVGDLLDIVWIQGEANEQGITITDKEVAAKLAELKKQNFKTDAEYQAFIKKSGYNQADVDLRVKLQVLSADIQKAISDNAPQPTSEEISDYYEAAKTQFTTPASRDVRLILNADKAKVEAAKKALEADDSDASWQTVAKKYSTDPTSKDNGGLRAGTTKDLLPEPLNGAVFTAAEKQVEGPVQVTKGPKPTKGYYIFEVEKVTPESVQPLEGQVSKQIKGQLAQQDSQSALQDFISGYSAKWTSRTICSAEIAAVVNRCSNYSGSVRPTNAPASCFQAHPKKQLTGCPAPVAQVAPAIPGTVSPINLQGTRLPQRPRPVGLKPPVTAGAPGASNGIPPGATAPAGATP